MGGFPFGEGLPGLGEFGRGDEEDRNGLDRLLVGDRDGVRSCLKEENRSKDKGALHGARWILLGEGRTCEGN